MKDEPQRRTGTMKLLLIGLAGIVLTGCLPNNCPLAAGDRVENIVTGKGGTVMGIASHGRGAVTCNVSVLHDDNTLSRSEILGEDGGFDTPDYVANWKYSKAKSMNGEGL
jgi:hypothetical protein